jgi:hypothetical protein
MKRRLSLDERLDQAWRVWNDALDGLDDADFERAVYRQWNLKDIVGHVFSYLDLAVRHLQSYKKRKRLASPRAPSYSYFNRREAERLRGVPVVRLRADMAAAHRKLMELLPMLTGEDLRKVFPAQWRNSRYHTTLRTMLRENAEHMVIHAVDIASWRKRQYVGK